MVEKAEPTLQHNAPIPYRRSLEDCALAFSEVYNPSAREQEMACLKIFEQQDEVFKVVHALQDAARRNEINNTKKPKLLLLELHGSGASFGDEDMSSPTSSLQFLNLIDELIKSIPYFSNIERRIFMVSTQLLFFFAV